MDYCPERYQTVVKSNELVKSRHELSLVEQRIMLYLISKVQPEDDDFQFYDFSISDFCKVCGISTSGRDYMEVRSVLLGLHDKSWWQRIGDEEVLMSWVQKARLVPNSGMVRVRLDEDLKPFLLCLKSNFTKYQLIHCLAFKSQYSMRMYEYLCSIHFASAARITRRISLEELQAVTGAEKYKTWGHLRERVLDPACREINAYSDKDVSYQKIKNGRSVIGILLTIDSKEKKVIDEIETRVNRILDGEKTEDDGQMSLYYDL